jgi:hypothetical protein
MLKENQNNNLVDWKTTVLKNNYYTTKHCTGQPVVQAFIYFRIKPWQLVFSSDIASRVPGN